MLAFDAEAAGEFEEVAAAIEYERAGHGELFIREVLAAIDQAERFPKSGRRVPDAPERLDARTFPLRRFPYTVVTAWVANEQTVIAVAHQRRAPGYWKSRVE